LSGQIYGLAIPFFILAKSLTGVDQHATGNARVAVTLASCVLPLFVQYAGNPSHYLESPVISQDIGVLR
jgi:hypothetical protein